MLTELWTQPGTPILAQDLDQWGDILIILVMAALWLAGALAKVITGRKAADRQQQQGPVKQQRQRESWQERLARKAEELQRAAEGKARQPEQSARVPRPPAGKITVRQGPRGESVMVYERPAPAPVAERKEPVERRREIPPAVAVARPQPIKPPPIEPRIAVQAPGSEPIIESMAAIMREPPKPLAPETASVETVRPTAGGYQPAAIIDYNDPDALRKAIFHYEILGRPLALREPPEDSSSF